MAVARAGGLYVAEQTREAINSKLQMPAWWYILGVTAMVCCVALVLFGAALLFVGVVMVVFVTGVML